MKENGNSVIGKVTEATRGSFDGLYLGVETFRGSVGDSMFQVGHDVVDMSFDHLGHFHHGR